jgi:hypothetical protein
MAANDPPEFFNFAEEVVAKQAHEHPDQLALPNPSSDDRQP